MYVWAPLAQANQNGWRNHHNRGIRTEVQDLQEQIDELHEQVQDLQQQIPPLMPGNTSSLRLSKDNGEYAYILDAEQSGLDLTGSFTVEAWVKPSRLGDTMCIVCKYAGGNNRSYAFQVGPASRASRITFSRDGGIPRDPSESNTPLLVNVWQHVAVTYDSTTGACAHYLNGERNGLCTREVGGAYDSVTSFAIGASYETLDEASQFFDGHIDEVRVWNVVRSHYEISSNFDEMFTEIPDGLISYWNFEDGFEDRTDNHNDLISIGGEIVTEAPF